MKLKTITPILLLLALSALPAVMATAPGVLRVDIEDTIHPITDEHIERALAAAAENKDAAVLILLSTPGGLADSTRKIVERMLASPVPVIVYVAPSGARAASAGFFILQAADIAAMAPGTNTGAAHPVMIGASGEDKTDDTMKEKIAEDSAAFIRAYVAKRGRNVEAAESAVRQSKSFTEQEALKLNLIEVVAAGQSELLEKLHGREVKRFDGSTARLDLEGKPVRDFEMTLRQRILAFIMNPNVAFILLSIGMLALYAEFMNPGAVIPGVVGFIFVLLAVFALNILPTSWAAIALIVAAFILFALEAQIASHGVLGAGGVAMLVLGALLLVDGPIPEMRVSLVTALAVAIPLGLITVFLVGLAIRAHRNKSMMGQEGMVEQVATARTDLVPGIPGKVILAGEIWDAVAGSHVPSGAPVVVRRVDGLLLHVEPIPGATDRAGAPARSQRA